MKEVTNNTMRLLELASEKSEKLYLRVSDGTLIRAHGVKDLGDSKVDWAAAEYSCPADGGDSEIYLYTMQKMADDILFEKRITKIKKIGGAL